jgi:hypothetical protein
MTITDFDFEGGHVFNNQHYPDKIMMQSLPMLKQMGKNVDLTHATVNVAGATRDLTAQGYTLRSTSSVETMNSVDSTHIDNRLAEMLSTSFEEDIRLVRGDDVILRLLECAMDNQIASTSDGFFASSQRSEGHYYSYQLTFYSMRKASFCFIVLSLCAFKRSSSVFGIPSGMSSGIAYNAQVFEVKKTYNNVIYNFGRLKAGEAMGSPDGKHRATLGTDGNFKVDSRWETGTAGKGTAPHYLTIQEDANLVLYGTGGATWSSGSQPGRFSSGPYRLELQDDGNLVVYDSQGSALWAVGI